MPLRAHHRVTPVALALCLALALLTTSTSRPAHARAYGVALQTAVDTSPASGPYERAVFSHIRAVGAQMVRIAANWNEIAPDTPPGGFDPTNPDSPGYRWGKLDRAVLEATAQGLTPFLTAIGAPAWAESPPGSGEAHPEPAELEAFADALARRYDGSHGLPWVRYFEVWNEPNASYFLQPQIEGSSYPSVDLYRTMINDFSGGVHGVRADDIVIAGALFPNGLRRAGVTAIAPLDFTRRLLCMSAGPNPQRICEATVSADVWSVHPYTSGGPSTRAVDPDNVWIYNLGALSSLVKAAQAAGTLYSSQPVQTWVTEFSWDSSPPDPKGVPLRLQQRWVAEALYRAWLAGIKVFTWYSLRDDPIQSSPQQAGLYFDCPQGIACDTPKPMARAFRFPFVAYRTSGHKALLWGRTPTGAPGAVQIQWRQRQTWRSLTTLRTDGDGIFTAIRALPAGLDAHYGVLRAVGRGEASPSFSLHHPQDIIVMPFGS
jgi:hypothetical protein